MKFKLILQAIMEALPVAERLVKLVKSVVRKKKKPEVCPEEKTEDNGSGQTNL